MRTLRAFCLVAIFVLSVGNIAYSVAPIARDPSVEIALFHKAGLPAESRNLLNLLRHNPGSPHVMAEVRRLIRQLGSDSFAQREQAEAKLREWGVLAQPVLKENLKNVDVEVSNRIRRLLARLGRVAPLNSVARMALPRAAIRLLVRRRAEGTIPALLRYLPQANPDEEVEIYYGLDELLAHDPKSNAALEAALADAQPSRRAVAACILARTGDARLRAKAHKAVRDPDPMVRLRAAQGALAAKVKDPAVLPVLIALLEQPTVAITWQAEELLHYAAGDSAPNAVVAANTEAERKACHVAWAKWWQNKSKTLDLTRLDEGPRRPGLVLVCEQSQLWLAGCDGQPRFTLTNASNMRRPLWRLSGSILAQEFDGEKSFVVERGLDGKVMWKRQIACGPEAGLRLLPNGHCLVSDAKGIVELDSAGKIISEETEIAKKEYAFVRVNWEGTVCGFTMGHGIGGSAVWYFFYPASELLLYQWLPADRPAFDRETIALLPQGEFLVAERAIDIRPGSSVDRLSRFNQRGKRVGKIEKSGLFPLMALPNGNLLVNNNGNHPRFSVDSLAEVDADNRLVWEAAARHGHILGGDIVYPVLRFGFSRPRTQTMDCSSTENRLLALTSRDTRIRALAMKCVFEDEAKMRKDPQAKRIMRTVVALLDDTSTGTRFHAFQYVAAKPEEASEAIPKLIEWLDNDAAHIAAVLSQMGPQAVPALVKVAEDAKGTKTMRGNAYTALGRHAVAGNKQAIRVLRTCLQGTDRKLRLQAMNGLALRNMPNNPFIMDLVRLLDDKDAEIAMDAWRSLGFLGPIAKPAIPVLLKKLDDPRSRLAALDILGRAGFDDPHVLDALLQYARPKKTVREHAWVMRNLWRFGAKHEVLLALREGLKDNRLDPEAKDTGLEKRPVRAAAIASLRSLQITAREAAPALVAIVKDKAEQEHIRQKAFHALTYIDPKLAATLNSIVPK